MSVVLLIFKLSVCVLGEFMTGMWLLCSAITVAKIIVVKSERDWGEKTISGLCTADSLDVLVPGSVKKNWYRGNFGIKILSHKVFLSLTVSKCSKLVTDIKSRNENSFNIYIYIVWRHWNQKEIDRIMHSFLQQMIEINVP